MKEHKDYLIIPAAGLDEVWDVRIISGEFVETILRYGAIKVDVDQITFNFDVIVAPSDYISDKNEDLRVVVGEILIDILEQSIKDGSAIIDEVT